MAAKLMFIHMDQLSIIFLQNSTLQLEGPCYMQIENIIIRQLPDLTPIKDQNIKILLRKCWSKNPTDRPSFKQIVKALINPTFCTELGVDNSAVMEYLHQFDLVSADRFNQDDDSQIELKTMKICGDNSQYQLCQTPNNEISDN